MLYLFVSQKTMFDEPILEPTPETVVETETPTETVETPAV